jgi:putative ABC transport system substrate-binding protein
MRRREFITFLGSAAAWPIAARAQPRQPVLGFLNGATFGGATATQQANAIRQGLRESGYVEGQNLAIEYRSAEGQYDRLPALAADLVSRQVDVIVAVGSTNTPQAARAATSRIPIVFAVGSDPVDTGLITNLKRPEANLTGVTFSTTALAPKRLQILRELVPGKTSIGYLKNSANPFDTDMKALMEAARTLGVQISVFEASTDREFLSAFESMGRQHIAALILSTDATFAVHRELIAALASHHTIPTMYSSRESVMLGGLISYFTERDSVNRQAGLYAGQILKGEKPADLPVVLPTKFGLAINLKTAKELGLTVPPTLLTRADEVIE